MRPFLFLTTVVSILGFHFSAFSADSKTLSDNPRLVIVGDSLTEGYGVSKESAYPFLLEKKLNADKAPGAKKWTVINSGISGSTTASAASRVQWVLKSKPDFLLIVLGANDGLRGLKVSESEKNLKTAIELAQKNKVTVFLAGIFTPPNYGEKYAAEFKKMYKDLSAEYKIPLMPFILEDVAGNSKLNLADGIHPNEKGHEIVSENLYQFFKKTFL